MYKSEHHSGALQKHLTQLEEFVPQGISAWEMNCKRIGKEEIWKTS